MKGVQMVSSSGYSEIARLIVLKFSMYTAHAQLYCMYVLYIPLLRARSFLAKHGVLLVLI